MSAAVGLRDLPALGSTGPYRALNRMDVTDVTGAVLAELSVVPPLFITRTIAAQRRAQPLPADDRVQAIRRAAALFATGTVGGMTVTDYQLAVARSGGTPLSVVRRATATVANRLSKVHYSVQHARPAGVVDDWRDPLTRTGRGVWQRRGEVFAAHTAGNHPGTHSLWPEALALGYRVAVRPSRREPFTPYRLVAALRESGFGPDQITLLPTGHSHADTLLREADRSIVYGGADVVDKYAGDPHVLTQGPGRTKILVTADVDWRDHLDTIVDSIGGHGGAGCVNTTAVFTEGDPAPLCAAIAERLGALSALPPEHDDAVLPVQRLAAALAIEKHLLRRAAGSRPWLGGNGVVADLGDGSAALLPAVHQLDRPDAPQAGVELPFPCVWVAPWTRQAGVAPLRHSLVITLLSTDAGLADALVAEPTIGNVYVGDHRTYVIEPGLPHDGFLAEFLMRSKTVIRD